MYLSNISILNYKNISEATLDLSPKINCLIGDNGEGKTNFLDAVYYMSFCRSAGTPIDAHIIRHGENFLMIDALYHDENDNTENIYCGVKRGSRKHFKRNKKEYQRLSMHIGLIPLILISPSDVSLIDGGSEERRRLMDVVISQYDINYIEALNRYNKALQQRNSLLKQEEEPDPSLMEIIEEQMATEGITIYNKRTDFITTLEPIFQHYYHSIVNNTEENVSIKYVSHCQQGDLIDIIKQNRWRDRAVGYSLHGIHRDDLEMLINGYPVKREGSQGQNKTYVIALKLAQFNLLKEIGTKRIPILLLDDIFDKLDAKRVAQIVSLVSGNDFGQIFLTDTNRTHLDQIMKNYAHDYKIFKVNNGQITVEVNY